MPARATDLAAIDQFTDLLRGCEPAPHILALQASEKRGHLPAKGPPPKLLAAFPADTHRSVKFRTAASVPCGSLSIAAIRISPPQWQVGLTCLRIFGPPIS